MRMALSLMDVSLTNMSHAPKSLCFFSGSRNGLPPTCPLPSEALYQCSCARTTRAQMRQPNPRPESRENPCIEKFGEACHKAGATPPSYKAIQSRVRDFDLRQVITRRMGPKQAAQRLSLVKAGLHVNEALQLLQMDHTLYGRWS
jgi:hypothetical protein